MTIAINKCFMLSCGMSTTWSPNSVKVRKPVGSCCVHLRLRATARAGSLRSTRTGFFCRRHYPVARWALIARGTAYSNRFPVPSGCGLPHISARSATTLDFSRPAQRSLAITACRLAASPRATHLSRGLRRLRYLHRRSDSYRLERPSWRARISLADDQHLPRFTAHTSRVPVSLPLTKDAVRKFHFTLNHYRFSSSSWIWLSSGKIALEARTRMGRMKSNASPPDFSLL